MRKAIFVEIGDIASIGTTTGQAQEAKSCDECAFLKARCHNLACFEAERFDGKRVHFIKEAEG